MAPEKSAGIIVYYLGDGKPKYLLLHYQSGHWGFPKGHIEPGEDPDQTALRELAEETGIDRIFLHESFKGKVSFYYTREGQTLFKEVEFFLGQSPAKEVTICEEHIGFRWLTYDMAVRALTFKNEQELLTKAEHWIKTMRPKAGGSFSGAAALGGGL